GGALTLDELKDLKKLADDRNLPAEVRRDLQKQIDEYDRWLAKQPTETDPTDGKAVGQNSKIGSQGPRQTNGSDNPANPAQPRHPQPPLEFRDIYRTRPDAVPPKKQ